MLVRKNFLNFTVETADDAENVKIWTIWVYCIIAHLTVSWTENFVYFNKKLCPLSILLFNGINFLTIE